MILTTLTDIIKAADPKAIKAELKRLGYFNCAKDKQMQKLGIPTLFKGKYIDTDTFPNSNGNRTYQGAIFTQVPNCEQYEFIMVNINDNKNTFPIDLWVWAKKIEK